MPAPRCWKTRHPRRCVCCGQSWQGGSRRVASLALVPMVPAPALSPELVGSFSGCPSPPIAGPGWRRQEEITPPCGRAALPYPPPEPSLRTAFAMCPSVFNIDVPDPPPPPRGHSEGPRLYAAHADRQQPGSARQSRPLSACHLKIKAERGGGGSGGKPGLPASPALRRCPGDRAHHPRGGFGHVSEFLGLSDAARMANPKLRL